MYGFTIQVFRIWAHWFKWLTHVTCNFGRTILDLEHLPQSITSLRNEKPQFKVALKKNFYVHTPFTLWMNFLHVQKICIAELHDCVNSYTVITLYVLYAFVCFWHVPHPIVWWQPQGSMECIYVCRYPAFCDLPQCM